MPHVGSFTGLFVAALLAGWLSACADDDAPRLAPFRDCTSDEQCARADDRYDVCNWVCEANVTYCRASCETDEDCLGIGLPGDYVFCDVPRPGEGFCNQYGYAYEDDACKQEVPPVGGEPEPQDDPEPSTGDEPEPEPG